MNVNDVGYIDYAEYVHEKFSLSAKSYAFMVDLIPLLKYMPIWFPGASFKRQARQWREDLDVLAQVPFDTVKSDIKSGDFASSYVADHLLDGEGVSKDDEHDIMWTAARVGSARLPTLDDQPNLPYITACVKEVLRWWTVAPIALPYRAIKDKVFGTYFIHAGSTVVANIWGMMHDGNI